ncbi:hypothetical protein FRC06_006669 [Ceratobasidium sp. 370]|nr:hypothetical protein FRC06_006669 [Ceratobasidium sp. 370]
MLRPMLMEYKLVETELVGRPGVGDGPPHHPSDLMLVRHYISRKEYILPESTGFNANGKELIEKYLAADCKMI